MPEIDSTQRVRAFVSIELPPDVLSELQDLQRRLESRFPENAVRWNPPGQIHLTLKFFGNVDAASLPELRFAFQTVCRRLTPLQLGAAGVGCFPSPSKPRVIWAGVTGELAKLEALQIAIDAATRRWSERAEERNFRPHLTLGRIRERNLRLSRQIGRELASSAAGSFGQWEVREVCLMQSKLSSNEAEHTVLASAGLLGAS